MSIEKRLLEIIKNLGIKEFSQFQSLNLLDGSYLRKH